MAAIDVLDPFNFGQTIINTANTGGFGTGADVQLGGTNITDPNDTTLIKVQASRRAAFAAGNIDAGDGTVGVLGQSGGSARAIGVAGQSSTGAGVYGIATDENSSGRGIGVVGRAMGGVAVESNAVEEVIREPVGVLGHSSNGPGVRGHGGPLLPIPQGSLTFSVVAAPGGVFSSGQLQDQVSPPASTPQAVSLDALPQLRLVPSAAGKLPTHARIGDLFMALAPSDPTGAGPVAAALFICTTFDGVTPLWQRVALGPPASGGARIP
jgi:hypothetical protein